MKTLYILNRKPCAAFKKMAIQFIRNTCTQHEVVYQTNCGANEGAFMLADLQKKTIKA